jgi:pimeloyl-ACP methyl ester carboxylesterase
MSTKEIDKYYQVHSPKPSFHILEKGNMKLFYAIVNEERKDLPLIIFIHGAPGAWYGYINYLSDSALVKKYRMISIDRIGYHYSSHQKAVTSIDEQAKSILPLVNQYSNGKCLLVGRSYGAPIAACIANDAPEKVSSVLFISSAVNPDKEKFWWFSKPIYYPPIRWMMPRMINHASDEKFKHEQELRKISKVYMNIHQPSIILQGGLDFIIDKSNGSYLDSALTNSTHRYILLPKNGHLITNENKPMVVKCIEELIP